MEVEDGEDGASAGRGEGSLHEAIPGGIEREAYEIIEAALEIEDD